MYVKKEVVFKEVGRDYGHTCCGTYWVIFENEMKIMKWMINLPYYQKGPRCTGVSLVVPNGHFYLLTTGYSQTAWGIRKEMPSWRLIQTMLCEGLQGLVDRVTEWLRHLTRFDPFDPGSRDLRFDPEKLVMWALGKLWIHIASVHPAVIGTRWNGNCYCENGFSCGKCAAF